MQIISGVSNWFGMHHLLTKHRDIFKRLERDGWTLKRVSGGHYIFTKPGFRNNIVPNHSNELSPGVVADIYRVAGWPKD